MNKFSNLPDIPHKNDEFVVIDRPKQSITIEEVIDYVVKESIKRIDKHYEEKNKVP